MKHEGFCLCLCLVLTACGAATPEGVADNDTPLGGYDGLFSGAPDNDSLPNEMKADFPYPELHTDLLAFQSPVRNQGGRAVCTIFSITALMEHLYIKAGWPAPDFSEQYLQWSVKFLEKVLPDTSESSPAANLKAIHDHGLPPEEAWPYEPFPWSSGDDPACTGEGMPTKCYTNGHPSEGAKQAARHFLPPGRYINTKSIKHHIFTEKTGVAVTLDFFYQSWNHRRSTLPTNPDNWRKGIVLAPNEADLVESHKHPAGHSILILGWDDNLELPLRDRNGKVVLDERGDPVVDKGFFIFKNSWGTGSFGEDNPHGDGYGLISIRYVDEHGSAMVGELPSDPGQRDKEASFSGMVAYEEMAHHTVQLKEGAKEIRVRMTGTNDADLYTRFGAKPTEADYDCYPFVIGSDELCIHPEAKGDTLEIGVYGAALGSSDYTIAVSWKEPRD